MPAGPYVIQINKPEYASVTRTVTLVAGEPMRVRIKLARK